MMAERKNVIVVIKDGEPLYVFGGVVDMCNKMKDFKYNYLKGKTKYPYDYKGYKIYRIKFK